MPKLNNNDTEYLLVEWLAEDGAEVVKGDPVVVLETSKAAEELVAEADGVLRQAVRAGAACVPGDVIASISYGSAPPPAAAPVAAHEDGGPVVTAPAQALIDEHGVDPARIRALGKKLIKRADVESLLEADDSAAPADADDSASPHVRPLPDAGESASPHVEALPDVDDSASPEVRRLPAVQRAVAAAVTRSHRSIPAAFTAVKVDAGPAVARARALGKEVRALIGLPELLVAAVASLHGEFPMCFAEPVDGPGGDLSVRHSDRPNVGVTVDVGHGLYVPVLRDAGALSPKEIAERLTAYRTKAAHGAFREDDLAGGNIVVTLHTDAAVLLAVPIVFPGQTCALSLCAPQHEFALDSGGNVVKRTTVTLGLAFDHRLVNGREAAMFLNALRKVVTAT